MGAVRVVRGIPAPQERRRRFSARAWVPLVAVAATLVACETSPLGYDQPVRVHGRTVDAEGDALAGVHVKMRKALSGGEFSGALRTETEALGLSCVVRIAPPACRDTVFDARSRQDGSFAFDVFGGDVQGGFTADVSTMHVATELPPADASELAGPATALRFSVRTPDRALPDMTLWRPRIDLESDRERAVVRWPPPPHRARSSRIVFDDGKRALVWAQNAQGGAASVDPRVLEDVGGGVQVAVADSTRDGTVRTLRSARVAYRSGAGVPTSRGRACWYTSSTGGHDPQRRCQLTDGRFDETRDPIATPPCPDRGRGCPLAAATIDLGSVRLLSFVVARPCPDGCVIEVSRDGAVWSQVAGEITPLIRRGDDSERPFGASAALSPPVDARYVRASVPGDTSGLALAEVSAWDTPARGGVRAVAAEEIDQIPTRPPWLALVAAALILLCVSLLIDRALPRGRTRPPPRGRGYAASIAGASAGAIVLSVIALSTVPLWFMSRDPDATFGFQILLLFVPIIVITAAIVVGAPAGCWVLLRALGHRGAGATAVLSIPLVGFAAWVHPVLAVTAVPVARAIVLGVMRVPVRRARGGDPQQLRPTA